MSYLPQLNPVIMEDQQRSSQQFPLVKQIFKKAVFSPHKWYKLTKNTKNLIKNGDIYISGKSPKQENIADSFMLTEWNLGGAKTSRILEKQLDINIRETSPNQWEINTIVHVFHPGGIDEPLSQEWKGVMEIQAPFFISTQKKSNPNTFLYLRDGKHSFSYYDQEDFQLLYRMLSKTNNKETEPLHGLILNDQLIESYSFRKSFLRKYSFGREHYEENQKQKNK